MDEYIEHDILGHPTEAEEMELYNFLSFKLIHEFGVPERYSALISGTVSDVRKLLDFDLHNLCYFDGSPIFGDHDTTVLSRMEEAVSSIDLNVSLRHNLFRSFVNYVVDEEIALIRGKSVGDFGISKGLSRHLLISSPATLYNLLFDRLINLVLTYAGSARVDDISMLDRYLREIVQEIGQVPPPHLSKEGWESELERIVQMNRNELGYSYKQSLHLKTRLKYHNSITGYPLGEQLNDRDLSFWLSITKLLAFRFMECFPASTIAGIFSDLITRITV